MSAVPYLIETDDHYLVNLDHVAVFVPLEDRDQAIVGYTCKAIDGTDLGRVSPAVVESLRTELELDHNGLA